MAFMLVYTILFLATQTSRIGGNMDSCDFVQYADMLGVRFLHSNWPAFLKWKDVFKLSQQECMRINSSNYELELGLVHLNRSFNFTISREHSKIFVMTASKPINNNSVSPFYMPSCHTIFAEVSFLLTKTSMTVFHLSDTSIPWSCFHWVVFSIQHFEDHKQYGAGRHSPQAVSELHA